MELPSTEVLRVLRSKGVEALFHANTVSTCCTFFYDGHLLARGVVHERGLNQTDQRSDKIDRELGIWYDIFFDAIDIHKQSSNRCYYGPVLLQFDLDLLKQDWLPRVWIAKSNPENWTASTPESERWFTSIEELERLYRPTNFGFHLVLRNVGGSIRLNPYLKSVTIDNPQRDIEVGEGRYPFDVTSAALGGLRAAARVSKMLGKVSVGVRSCPPGCNCTSLYKRMSTTEFKKNFYA